MRAARASARTATPHAWSAQARAPPCASRAPRIPVRAHRVAAQPGSRRFWTRPPMPARREPARASRPAQRGSFATGQSARRATGGAPCALDRSQPTAGFPVPLGPPLTAHQAPACADRPVCRLARRASSSISPRRPTPPTPTAKAVATLRRATLATRPLGVADAHPATRLVSLATALARMSATRAAPPTRASPALMAGVASLSAPMGPFVAPPVALPPATRLAARATGLMRRTAPAVRESFLRATVAPASPPAPLASLPIRLVNVGAVTAAA